VCVECGMVKGIGDQCRPLFSFGGWAGSMTIAMFDVDSPRGLLVKEWWEVSRFVSALCSGELACS